VREQRTPRGRDRSADAPRVELQHARNLVTAAEAIRQFPFAGLSAALLNGDSDVSYGTLDDYLEGREACLLAAFEQVLARAAERASAAFDAQEGWLDRVRAALMALLEFFDEQPALARYCVVHSAQAGPTVLAARCEVLDRLARVLDDERAPARGYPPPITAQAVVSGALGVLQGRLLQPDPRALVELTGPLMSFIVLPFLGANAARRELSRSLDAASALALGCLQEPGGRPSHSTVSVLKIIAAEPGLNNRGMAVRAGVTNEGHMSRILMRMVRLGLIRNARDAGSPVRANAWQLTASGAELESALRHQESVAIDVPEEFGGRMDYSAVSVLRVIGDQPWLYGREVALRAGIKDQAQIARLLARLTGLGLVEGARDAHRKGTPNAWRLTASGEQLDQAIGRETPAPPRSPALDLMWRSGGRLSDNAVSVLKASAAEAGLSNNEIALRVGINDKNSISQLLAHLARRGLIENTRTGGRYNVWQLTASGIELETAIRQETPAPVARRIALDLLRDRGGRLTNRTVSVLRLIGAEPGLSNNEIARRVAIKGKGDASTLLARLARHGLIENTRTEGREKAWQLTRSGIELDKAIGRETPAPERSSPPRPWIDRVALYDPTR
jgi:DNA-binding IclR family transcriptional regulator/AcrR family transcriptional regulator